MQKGVFWKVVTVAEGIVLTGTAALGAAVWKLHKQMRKLQEEVHQLKAAMHRLEKHTMARFDDMTALITALDEETNRIADALQELKDQLAGAASGSMTEEQETEIQELLTVQIDRLRGIGATPSDPIPEVEPEA